jgi:dihydrofolate reductase
MSRTIVIEFATLDGVIEDPDGSQGTSGGGWAFRHGPEAVAGDKFRLGPIFDTGVLLLGRRTWEMFAGIWPSRTDDFATAMNRIPKLVATRTRTDLSAWPNSAVLGKDLVAGVKELTRDRDVVVAGSASIVHSLADADLVDEYRILLFPTALGRGSRLFQDGTAPAHLRLVSTQAAGQAVLLRYERADAS